MIRALNTAGLSDLEKRVVKATYDDDDPPKQKHVEALILLSADHELVPILDRRVVSPLWTVCLKSLCLIHKLSVEADERFLAELQSAPSLLSVQQQFDTSVDPTATAHTRFIHAYAAYLLAKVRSFAALHASCERQQPAESKRWVMKLKVAALVKGLPLLQKQFDALLLVQPANSEDLNHPIPIACMTLAIRDAFRLYSVLTVMMLAVLERYETMTLPQTERMLLATHKFLSQNSKFRKWADKLCKNGFVDKKLLPKFDAIPVTFLQLLEEHIVELGGLVTEPTPTPTAVKQRSPRPAAVDSSRERRSSAKQTAATSRRGKAGFGRDEEQYDEEVEGGGAEEDEQHRQQYDEQDEEEEQSEDGAAVRGRPARGPIERKRSSQVRSSGVRRAQYEGGYGRRQQEAAEDAEQREEEGEENEEEAVEQVRQPRRGAGGATGRGGRVAQQPQPQQQPQRLQRAVNSRANAQAGRPTASAMQRRPVPSQPQPYQDEQEADEAEQQYPYDQPPQQLPSPQPRLPQSAVRPAALVRLTQPQPQRPTQQAGGATAQRNSRPTTRQETLYDEYYEEGHDDAEESEASAADDPLALYMHSAAPLFPPSTSKQQQQQQSLSVFSPLSASSRPTNQSTVSASRSAAKARVAAALSSELNLFDNFDPLTLHPAEQRALDRQQADMQAAFFTNPPPAATSSSASSLQPPPPAYEVEPYDTNDEGMDEIAEQHAQQHQPTSDLFSDLTAKLNIDDSDHPPQLPVPAASRATARSPAAKQAAVVRPSAALANTQRHNSSGRTMQQPQARPRSQQPAPAYADADEEDEDGSEPNFM